MRESTSCALSVSFAACNASASCGIHAVGPSISHEDIDTHTDAVVPTMHDNVLPPTEPPPESPTFLAGSIINHIIHKPNRPCLPTTPFEFPSNPIPSFFSPRTYKPGTLVLRLAELPNSPSMMDSITWVVGSPCVFGLRSNSTSYV
jgi:hypothetical protein